jgi:hypothetical protein
MVVETVFAAVGLEDCPWAAKAAATASIVPVANCRIRVKLFPLPETIF